MVEEISGFTLPDPALVARMRANVAELKALGIEAIDD